MANCSSLYILHPVDKIADRAERAYWTAYALLSEFITLKFGRWRKGGRTISSKYHSEWFDQQLEDLGYSPEKVKKGYTRIIKARFFVADHGQDYIQAKWTVPKPWYYLFESTEKHQRLPDKDEDAPPTLIYETTVEKALNRLRHASTKAAESEDEAEKNLDKSLGELQRFLSSYPPESLVILDCSEIIGLMQSQEIKGEES